MKSLQLEAALPDEPVWDWGAPLRDTIEQWEVSLMAYRRWITGPISDAVRLGELAANEES